MFRCLTWFVCCLAGLLIVAQPVLAADVEHAKAPLIPSNAQEIKDHAVGPALWTLVIFVILLAILYPVAWKPVLAGLKAREQRIRSDIAEAEATRQRAEATLKEYNGQLAAAEARVRDMLGKAQTDGERLATSIRMQAQQEAEEAKERATRDIDAAKDAAIREVHEQTAELATSIAGKILRRNLNPDDQRELVKQSLEQLQTVKS
jgi:F-type H+-transporting ATPase subunit b